MSTGINVDELLLGGVVRVAAFSQTFTDAQIKAMPVTPVSLTHLPAVTGKQWVIVKGKWRANTAVAAYTNIDPTLHQLRLVYGNNIWAATYQVSDDSGSGLTEVTDLLGVASVRSVPMHNWDTQPIVVANAEGLDVRISMNSASGALTGGNAANTLTVSGIALLL